MNSEQLSLGLAAKFHDHRIVFWYDPERSFSESLEALSLTDVTVVNMEDISTFQIKKRIELDEPDSQFLLYFPHDIPEIENDWLLDIRLYSDQFYADASSMLLNELGITRMALRSHIQERKSFFASKKRLEALKKRVDADESELSVDLKMMAVLAGAESSSLDEVLLKLFFEYAEHLEDSGSALSLQQNLDKFGLLPSLYTALFEHFGYHSEDPSVEELLLKLFCTELWTHLEGDDKNWFNANVLSSIAGRATATAFMTTWRDSRRFAEDYDRIAKDLENKLDAARSINPGSFQALIDCETFEVVEQLVIKQLVNALLGQGQTISRGQIDEIINKRMSGHWCQMRTEYAAIYDALKAANALFALRRKYTDGFHFDTAEALYTAYTDELYQFDQLYRQFNEQAGKVLAKGADILRQLDNAVEEMYCHWYLFEMGLSWDKLLESQCELNGSLSQWRLNGIPHQKDFYRDRVQVVLKKSQVKRVFVVISDALRFEVAEELCKNINGHKRFKADLESQLGVLPSYTQLGMASLLPHTCLSYKDDASGVVMVDGQSTSGLENRAKILKPYKGVAVTAKELFNWSNQEGREKIRDAEVVYIYHDTIDAIGDKAATEDKTLTACRNGITELEDLVGRIINRLNASRVVVTADHGFLFRQQALASEDKTELDNKPENAFEAKKRYILGSSLAKEQNCWHGRVADTAESQCDTEFLLPKGANRFHFVGGARFVHGGAMPQEICVPVMTVRPLQKQQADKKTKQKVGVVVASQPIKLVNNIDKIRFLQTDAVSEGFIPRTLICKIVDHQGQTVSSEEPLVFNSESDQMGERTREARFKLIGSEFDRTAVYTLKMLDAETSTEYSQYSVSIDLAFHDDFF